MKKKLALLATLVVVLFVSCGFTTVNATSGNQEKKAETTNDSTEEYDSGICIHIEPTTEYGPYWNYLIKNLTKKYYYQLTDEFYKESQEYNYNVAVLGTNGKYFQALERKWNRENLISADDVISTIVQSSNNAGGLNNWNTIQLNNLDMAYYDEIIEKVREDGSRTDVYGYEIADITKAKDGKRFSIRIETTTYLVIEGDTLSKIAEKKLTTVKELVKLNPQIKDPDLIYPGWVLKIK